jgi:thiol-disulfide isomerase/thioredoxin
MRFAVCLAMVACASIPDAASPQRRNTAQLAAIEASADVEGKVVGKTGARATIVVVFASWCSHCRRELDTLAKLRRPALQILGLNYRGHEEYDGRGNADAVRRYVATNAPWLRVVPADDQLFDLLGRPPKVPTLYVYDRRGALVTIYDRRDRAMPDEAELRELLRRLGA